MDTTWMIGLLGFASTMAATPGPNNTMVAASGATYGLARTLPLIAGIATGVAAIMAIVVMFGSPVVADGRIGAALKWIGVAYLLWLAWKIGTAEPLPDGSGAVTPTRTAPLSLAQGLLLQAVNPKLWVMVSGAVVTYGQTGDALAPWALAVLFASIFGATTLVSTVAWAVLGASMGRLVVSRRASKALNGAMAALLVLSLIPIVVG